MGHGTPIWKPPNMPERCPERSPTSPIPLKLLIVEDSTVDAELLLHHLRAYGYQPVWERVDDETGLLKALERQRWELVLCDYTMPRYNGLDALKTIRRTAPDLPVILVSGTIGEEVAVEAMRAGAYDYLLKDRLTRLGAAADRSLQEAEQRRTRRQMEDQLRLLFHAIETSPAAILITDTEGRIRYANPGFTRMTGYSLDDVGGKNPSFLKSGTMATAEYSRMWKTIQAGKAWQGEFCNRRRDGQLLWESATISPVRDSQGTITHFVKVAEDITHRKQADEAYRKLDLQLRQVQKMESLGELASGIAHDFNSYLGSIVTNLQLARAGLDAESQTVDYLERAADASRQAAGLASQMLTLSRRSEPRRQAIQLGSVILETLRWLEASLPPDVKAAVDIPTPGRVVLADASQIQQLIVNLWSNACHALQDREGCIAVSLVDQEVDATLVAAHPELQVGPYVRLTVRDNGCGMDPEVREQVFEPFFTTKPEGQGTGLGLSIVRSIVNLHQGAVVVESWPGQGTTMHVFLPVDDSATVDLDLPVPVRERSLPLGHGEKIMLVEDHALVQKATRSLLEELGYQVDAFGDPCRALATFRAGAEDYDAVLTDLSMREMNGAELAREILAIRPSIPVLVTSGYDLPGIRQHIRELGIREVLAKPIERARLAVVLAQALGKANGSTRGG
jgi:PAS domain S-box-containing protein